MLTAYFNLLFISEFKGMEDIADFFRTPVEDVCPMFSRAVRALAEGGGSYGFHQYFLVSKYISTFMNKTGFPKFPLKAMTEENMSRFFQVGTDTKKLFRLNEIRGKYNYNLIIISKAS